MIRLFSTLTPVFGLLLTCTIAGNSAPESTWCDCDTLAIKALIASKNMNRVPQYDSSTFEKYDFYKLNSSINRALWYRDIENVDTTKFTNLWNDYGRANYHASHLDFVKYYTGKKDIELAFQLGPNLDLWAYHIFVIKKVGCCFLVTRSYFRHARFTYKAYAIINSKQLDSLYTILSNVNTQPVGNQEDFKYRGYFVDNRNKKQFFIDFDNETEQVKADNEKRQRREEVKAICEFVDNNIKWIKTYEL